MPDYEYICTLCRFEVTRTMTISEYLPTQTCPECKSVMRRLIGVPGVIFNGSGFYSNTT